VTWNLDDELIREYSEFPQFTRHGLDPLNLSFKPEDILFMSDGYCASTCALFAEFLRNQMGIDFLAMGGRPNDDITQAVGGVKGANNWGFQVVLEYVLDAWAIANDQEKLAWKGTEIASFTSYLPWQRASGSPGMNVRDALRKSDKTNTPLHFTYEAADCRMYYTADMVVDITAAWRAAADAKWLGKKQCVAGRFRNAPASGLKRRGTYGRQTSTTVSVSPVGKGVAEAIRGSWNDASRFIASTGSAMQRGY
jgi:hypothetical protein